MKEIEANLIISRGFPFISAYESIISPVIISETKLVGKQYFIFTEKVI